MKTAVLYLFAAWSGIVTSMCGLRYWEPRMWLLAFGATGFWMYLDRDRK